MESHVRTSLDQRLQSAQREHRLPSVVAGLCRDGELVWSGYAGTTLGEHASAPGDDVQYRIGSITKTFVAVLVMRLRDAGRLELTDPVGAYVPGTPVSEARIGELLSHASGLQAETGGPWWERTPGRDFETVLDSLDPGARTRPGRRHHYSNVGYAVLGELIARLHGEPWDQVLKETLLAPLGLRRTTPRPIEPHATGFAVHPFADVVLQEPEHDEGAMAPAGTLWSTVADLSRWAVFLSGHTAGLLTEATLAEMTEPLVVA
ncbi:MAG TPA: serine hydrolase domain-containing protein, partial [Jiangellaceae bacterium]|nr:serine hydrolase domain-containing protein [Jiangellaceae bacterium]